MKRTIKIILQGICFVASYLGGIFTLLSSTRTKAYINELIEKDFVARYNFHVVNWNIAVVILAGVLLCIAASGFLYGVATQKDKLVNIIMLFCSITVTLVVLAIFSYIVFSDAEYVYKAAVGANMSDEQYFNMLANSGYKDTILLLFVSSIPNIISFVVGLVCGDSLSINTISNGNEKVNDENSVIKNEIEKLKKQLELEELKEEYKSLYLKANKSKLSKTSDTTKDE